MNRLETLAKLLAEIEADCAALAVREQELAKQAEQLTMDARIHQAEALGQRLERERVVLLINAQLEQLGRAGLNAVSLRALREQIQGNGP